MSTALELHDDFPTDIEERIRFSMPDIGFREVRGYLSLEDDLLVIEVTDALMGEWDKRHQIVKVAYDSLVDIGISRGLFMDKLILRPKQATLLEVIPGENKVEVALKVWRKHRKRLERLVRSFLMGV